MNFDSAFASAIFGIASAATWGTGDFCGGLATRRAKVLSVVFVSQLVGLLFLVTLGLITREPMPAWPDVLWGAAAGLAGLGGLASLYTALSKGNMGLVAPVTGVISTALPVLFGVLSQGLPHPLQLLGFALAAAAVALISRSGNGSAGRPDGLGLAVLAGVSFGAFLILISFTTEGAVFWPLSAARTASVTILVLFMLLRRARPAASRGALPLMVLSGVMDAAGNFLFVLAEQAGRLDVASALSSLYPASTTLLALIVLRERLNRWQALGVALTLVAIVLITAG
jgi:drug/metabolite transporter (DMT)-like permease